MSKVSGGRHGVAIAVVVSVVGASDLMTLMPCQQP